MKVISPVSLFSDHVIEPSEPDASDEHPENAPSPMTLTLFGSVIDVKALQFRNALLVIVVIPSIMVTLTSPVLIKEGVMCISFAPVIIIDKMWHLSNALSPIVVTLFGTAMEVKEEHPENALSPIVVTLLGNVRI